MIRRTHRAIRGSTSAVRDYSYLAIWIHRGATGSTLGLGEWAELPLSYPLAAAPRPAIAVSPGLEETN